MTYINEFVQYMYSMCQSYWNGSPYPWILAISLAVCIFLAVRKKDRIAAFMSGFTIILLVVLFFPVTAKLIGKIIGSTIYWRMFWMLPVVPMISYAACACIRMIPEHGKLTGLLKAAATCAVCLLIMLMGSLHYTSGDFYKTVNALQIPDHIYLIGEMINEDRDAAGRGDEPVTVAAVDYVATYLRLYDPTILMPFGRRRSGAENKNARKLYQRINIKNYPEKLARRAHRAKCDYLVLTDAPEEQHFIETVMEGGYDYVGQVSEFIVLRENAEAAAAYAAEQEAKKAAEAAEESET